MDACSTGYAQAATRDYANAAMAQPADGRVADAINRVEGMSGVMEGTIKSMIFTLERLTGGASPGSNVREVPPCAPGQLGALDASLDRLNGLVEEMGSLVGPFARL